MKQVQLEECVDPKSYPDEWRTYIKNKEQSKETVEVRYWKEDAEREYDEKRKEVVDGRWQEYAITKHEVVPKDTVEVHLIFSETPEETIKKTEVLVIKDGGKRLDIWDWQRKDYLCLTKKRMKELGYKLVNDTWRKSLIEGDIK